MILQRKSILSGVITTRDLPVTQEQLQAFENGQLVQKVFPELSAAAREWLRAGLTEEEWNELYGEDE